MKVKDFVSFQTFFSTLETTAFQMLVLREYWNYKGTHSQSWAEDLTCVLTATDRYKIAPLILLSDHFCHREINNLMEELGLRDGWWGRLCGRLVWLLSSFPHPTRWQKGWYPWSCPPTSTPAPWYMFKDMYVHRQVHTEKQILKVDLFVFMCVGILLACMSV